MSSFMYKNKQQFLAIKQVSLFVEHLANLLTQGSFKHAYSLRNKETWECHSLLNAKEKYIWQKLNFAETKIKLNNLADLLKISANQEEMLINTIRVMEWGQVYRGCIAYALEKYDENQLQETINKAVSILDGTEYLATEFDQKNLRMDSGLTKVYSLASEQSIIYDSRVSAALMLIGYRFFGDLEQVAQLRIFAGGSDSVNSKKRSHINGVKIAKEKLNPTNQGHFNLVANWMLQEAIARAQKIDNTLFNDWSVKDNTQMLRAVEAALFMIGADISNG